MMRYPVDDIKDIMRERSCTEYTRERVEELWARRKAITPREIGELDIPVGDGVWILGKLLRELSPYRANKIARQFALEVADLWNCPDITWWYLVTGDKSFSTAALAAFGAASEAIAGAMSGSWDAATRTEKLKNHLNILVGAWEVTS